MAPDGGGRWRGVLPLVLLAAAAALLIQGLYRLAGERIGANREHHELAIVRQLLPVEYDNDPLRDRIVVSDHGRPELHEPVTVFRARRGGKPAGVVMLPVQARGYSGRIDLAVGIRRDGTLAGVRVNRQRETPGLGDRIHQDKSGWLAQFQGRSPDAGWALRDEGGEFDQLSGATITSRGVVNAVRSALEYYRLEEESLYR